MPIRPRFIRRLKVFVLTATLLLFSSTAQPKTKRPARPLTLEHSIEAILRRAEVERGLWGIEVVRLRDGKVLYTRNADHLFLPASNMKLFTTAAALEKLGPDFVFRTTVETGAGPDAQGRVGDLILVGRGDPNLGSRVLPYQLKTERQAPADAAFRDLADQVAAKGVREVLGNIVADDRYFVYEPTSRGWSADDLEWGYGAPVTALAFNDNALELRVEPGAQVGAKALVSLGPVPDYYRLDNRLETVAPSTPEQIYVERLPGSTELDVWGQVPLGKEVGGDTVSIADPPRLAGELFRGALAARGITVRGQVKVLELSRVEAATIVDPFVSPPPRIALAEHDSLPLREEIKVINKVSQNLHVEMLLRTMGRQLKNFGSLNAGLEVLGEFTDQIGVPHEEAYFADGSGLSRRTLVTPHAIIELLEYMAGSARFEVFFDSLPVAGVDGTLAERFNSTNAAGNLHAKTGTLGHVDALSGYMESRSGERFAFSILGNSHLAEARTAEGAIDQIALDIFERFAARKKRARPAASGKARGAGSHE